MAGRRRKKLPWGVELLPIGSKSIVVTPVLYRGNGYWITEWQWII